MSQIRLNISQSRGYEDYNLSEVRKYCNVFIELKMSLKKSYKIASDNAQSIRKVKVAIEKFEMVKQRYKGRYAKSSNFAIDGVLNTVVGVVNYKHLFNLKRDLANAYKLLEELEEVKEKNDNSMLRLEGRMIDLVQYGDRILSTHQKIQLLGGGVNQAREIIETLIEMEKLSSIEEVRFIDLVMHHTEYQWNKQRSRDWIDCKNWEMPVFTACRKELLRRMKKHEEETGRNFMIEFMEQRAKENGKKLVPLQTDIGTVLTFKEDIKSKYECKGKVIALKSGNSVTVYKK